MCGRGDKDVFTVADILGNRDLMPSRIRKNF